MKAIKYFFLLGLTLVTATACMNDFDEITFDTPPFGNNEIGAANTTIAELKSRYASTISASSLQEVTDNIIIEGVVVANDISGNIYKQFVIDDGTGSIIVGVNDVGLYATMAIGQKIAIDCKGLYVGGYGKLAQIGGKYNGSIGRMAKKLFAKHVRLLGAPSADKHGIEPELVTSDFFTNANRDNLPKYVRIENVKFQEADGTATYAPEAEANSSNVVERRIKVGNTNVIFRFSTYADFANEVLPTYKFNITGVLTRYNNYWQFLLTSTNDIEQVEE